MGALRRRICALENSDYLGGPSSALVLAEERCAQQADQRGALRLRRWNPDLPEIPLIKQTARSRKLVAIRSGTGAAECVARASARSGLMQSC